MANSCNYSTAGQAYVEAADILNYFLQDFFFNKNITHIEHIYFAYEQDKLAFFYPGGIATV
jgi:hypothetical protein